MRYPREIAGNIIDSETGVASLLHYAKMMETGKRSIGKERAKKLAEALHCDYRQLL